MPFMLIQENQTFVPSSYGITSKTPVTVICVGGGGGGGCTCKL